MLEKPYQEHLNGIGDKVSHLHSYVRSVTILESHLQFTLYQEIIQTLYNSRLVIVRISPILEGSNGEV